MSLSAAAAAMGLPEDLVRRSAEARAAETGGAVDDILAAWAGGEAAPAGTGAAAPAEARAAEPTAASEAAPPQQAAGPEATAAASPEVAAAPAEPQIAAPAPIPDEVTPAEAVRFPEVVTIPSAGIRERTNFVIPKWLTAVILVVPMFALYALGGSSTGKCGEATELQGDVVTGDIVNCDGAAFTGRQAAGGATDPIAVGADLYSAQCASCHGPAGEGVGSFPAMTGVTTTFGACADHKQWVSLGSTGWPDPVYGDTSKPVGVGMPPFGGSLTEEQLSAVVAFERARFGGADEDETLADCGLAETGDEEGDGAEGEADGDGGETDGGETDGGAEAAADPAG